MNTKLFTDLSTGSFEKRLFAYMTAVGLERITVVYSGGGDSGGMDEMEFQPAVNSAVETGIRQDLEEELCSPIYNRHGSFADGGGYYVNGQVTYNSKDQIVHISGTDRTTISVLWNEEEEDYESEETNEEYWEELLYNGKKDAKKFDADFQFVYFYARDYLKKKLPEELHNRMLTEASTGEDEYAIRYIKEVCCEKV